MEPCHPTARWSRIQKTKALQRTQALSVFGIMVVISAFGVLASAVYHSSTLVLTAFCVGLGLGMTGFCLVMLLYSLVLYDSQDLKSIRETLQTTTWMSLATNFDQDFSCNLIAAGVILEEDWRLLRQAAFRYKKVWDAHQLLQPDYPHALDHTLAQQEDHWSHLRKEVLARIPGYTCSHKLEEV